MPDSPMKEPHRELHIINGPVFSSHTNRWGADCSCGWRYSNERHGIVEAMAKKHDRGEPTPTPAPAEAAHFEVEHLGEGGLRIRGWRRG